MSDNILDYGDAISRWTNGFVRRQWLRQAVDGFLTAQEQRCFFLYGELCVGKTAFLTRLAQEQPAAMHIDPTDARSLSLRGYIANTLVQVAEARGQDVDRTIYYQKAAHLLETAAKLDPDEPGVHNGLGNVQHALGNLDAAIGAYARAIELAPAYAAAHHDLAIAYEDKMKADPAQAALWRQRALAEWRTTY